MNTPSQVAPVALFAYKRPNELRQTLDSLQANYLAPQTELFVFVDGPKKTVDLPKVEAVREIVNNIVGFKTVHRYYADDNHGLASSIIAGVARVIKEHGQVIVLEDDLLTSRNFLDYMNQCLHKYKHEAKVFSVSAYSFPFKKPVDYRHDGYFIQRPNSWGWATWADRWEKADWVVADYKDFEKDETAKKGFKQGGADLIGMLQKQQNKIIDSWYIRWCFSQYKEAGLTIYPVISKIQNIGFNQEATNTNIYNRYKTTVDDSHDRHFLLPGTVEPTDYYHRQNMNEYSLGVRLYNRIKTYSVRIRHVLSVRKAA